jgi:hypothetical protein
MALRDDIPEIKEYIEKNKKFLSHNKKVFDIYEGDLLSQILCDMQSQFSQKYFEQVKHRIVPINILVKIIDKLSKIYQQKPVRTIENGTDADTELLSFYEESFNINKYMNIGNEFFNMFKNCLIQPYVHKNKPAMRIIPSDRFLVRSTDDVNPMNPTEVIIFMGEKKVLGKKEKVYHIYSDTEFLIVNEKGDILTSEMAAIDNVDGVNVVGRLPFVYVNKSANLLIPKEDSDILKLTKVIPIILSDLNCAAMFQCFSIIYGINVNDENVVLAPNAFWSLKTEGNGEQKAEVGQLKPQVDIDQVLGLVESELSLWLSSKGIRPGSIGTMTKDSFASGISKIVDEMDTYEERCKQVEVFTETEKNFWDLLMNTLHPYWLANGMIDAMPLFSLDAKFKIKFAEQVPLIDRGQIVDTLKKEVDAGFTSVDVAIKKLNPEMTDQEIEDLKAEIESDKTVEVPIDETNPQDNMNQNMQGDMNGSKMATD